MTKALVRMVFACGVLAAATARAEDKLTVAFFAPNAPFGSGDARYSFVSRLAQQIEMATGLEVKPVAYARAEVFEAEVRKGKVDFAILDPVYLAEKGVPYPVLAIAASGGETQTRWVLYAAESSSIAELQGKRLAVATTSGRDAQFIDNALLDSELPRHFGDRTTAPDITSAVAAVALKKADCVFAPEGQAPTLRRIFEGPRLPNPALVRVRGTLPPDVVDKVKQATLAHVPTGAYDSWRGGSAEPYRALAGRLNPRTRRPVMAEPEIVRLDDVGVTPVALEPALGDIKDQFWNLGGTP